MDVKTNQWADVFTLLSDWCDSCIDKDYEGFLTFIEQLPIETWCTEWKDHVALKSAELGLEMSETARCTDYEEFNTAYNQCFQNDDACRDYWLERQEWF